MKFVRIDFSRKSPYEHLGGWLLVFTAIFALGTLGSLVSVAAELMSGIGFMLSDLIPLVLLALLVGAILMKSKSYRIFFLIYAVIQVVLLAGALAFYVALPGGMLGIFSASGAPVVHLSVIEMIIIDLSIIAMFVGTGFYFYTAKRVATYFRNGSV